MFDRDDYSIWGLRKATQEQPKTRGRKPRHIESSLQIACVLWFRVKYPKFDKLLFAVPNGGQRSAATARILKAEGVVAGVADLILLVPRGGFASLCIEMKAGKAGRQSEHQRAWQEAAEGEGNRYAIARSLEDFQQIITDYLGLEKRQRIIQ